MKDRNGLPTEVASDEEVKSVVEKVSLTAGSCCFTPIELVTSPYLLPSNLLSTFSVEVTIAVTLEMR